ncbi:MAG: hypothetical protein IPG17_18655 [Sandaracinaceae bacterium]|jgi:hypothetical protein|nr:hypothetical protein [Sandaracinaceae bacterium]MBP9106598.1 hypothetical protein [Gemmatimonadaceae bacterium]MBK6810235.1 hypothetical protein [Sandaracinaceae bacterium]MBK7153207.1 hypothetical protein [Sandaracinaceae bacterium]MBK7777657.1 hypothetical protein [Sandaracinaceae bacterium]
MGWNALLFGELEFPPEGVETWTALIVEPGEFKDKAWKRSPWMGDPTESTTVAGVLAKLAEHSRWCEEELRMADHQSVRIEGNRLSIRASINEDDFRSYAGDIATMLRLAARVGARGEYVAIAGDDMAGERLVLDAKGSHCEPVDLMGALTGGEVPESTLDYASVIPELFATTAAAAKRHAEIRSTLVGKGAAAKAKKGRAAKKGSASNTRDQ